MDAKPDPVEPELPRVLVTRAFLNLTAMQVCVVADATDEEILEVCNRENASGTEFGWVEVIRGQEKQNYAPVSCETHEGRTHYLVTC
jgi:hypothetical protein